MLYPEISERERFPMLSTGGRELLHRMRQHPHAPIWNWPNGEQLNESGLERVNCFAAELHASQSNKNRHFEWLDEFTEFCIREVPFYRRRAEASDRGTRFIDQPACNRDDLAPRVWDFVPDTQSLEELIVFSTSGTTGHPTRMLFDPFVPACGIPLIESVVARSGCTLPRGPEQVALTNVAAYRGAFTTAIVIAYLQEAGCVRVNLDDSAWRSPKDRELFIDQWQAPVWLGDPIAFSAMEKLELNNAPKAIVSSIMQLSPAYANRLAARYGCPVFDVYALTEVGILGVRTEHGHEIVPHDVLVEILGPDDTPVAMGQRGEVTVTSRRNPFMPLIRYRTGDYAAAEMIGGRVVLKGLEGRSPVLFPLASGRMLHSMEVTRLMRKYPLQQYRLHQEIDGRFRFGYRGLFDIQSLRNDLAELLELPAHLDFEEIEIADASNGKVKEYRSALYEQTT